MAREEFGGCIPYDLRIMIIDEDLTSLKLLQTILSSCHYKVATFCDADEALKSLWERRNEFDLVMAEYKMIQMRGLNLLERIFLCVNTPVITMCSDDDPKILSEALTNGACFHITKPISIANLDVVWQKSWRNKGNLVMDRLKNGKSMRKQTSFRGVKRPLEQIVEEGETKRRRREKTLIVKPRLMWGSELHRRFLLAIMLLGRGAIPSNIMSLMNVDGLTIKQVSTHLQKHRRRVQNAKKLHNEKILSMKSKLIQSQSDITGSPPKTKSYYFRTGFASKRLKFPTTINALTDKTPYFKEPKDQTPLLTRHFTLNDQRPILPKPKNSNKIMMTGVAKNNGLVMLDSSCGFDELQSLENKYWEVYTSRDQKVEDDLNVNNFLLDETFLAWMVNDVPK